MKSFRHLREARKRVLDAAIRAAKRRAGHVGPRLAASFQHLLTIVQARTTLLSPRVVPTDQSRAIVEALLAMAAFRADWKRPIDAWSPPPFEGSDALVFVALAEHLFALYAVPRFMVSAWLEADRGREAQRWYIRLGAGESVRSIAFPVRVNRRMAHAFRSAPDDLSVIAALRWAQVRGLGGSPAVARAVARTRIGRESADETFLAHVVAFLVDLGCEDIDAVNHLVDFFLERRRAQPFSSLEGVWPARTDPRADVALFGLGPRTRSRILRDWGGREHLAARPGGTTWKPAPFGGLFCIRVDGADARRRAWRIKELRSSDELRQEGIAMRHCVATYAPKCASGQSSIWSMTVEEGGEELRAVTIEVNLAHREIRQVKGPANRAPKKRVLEVLRRWVEEQGLTLATAR